MARTVGPHDVYTGRRPSARVLNTTIDTEAYEILHEFCPPGRRNTGRFLARLLYEHKAREDIRRELKAGMTNDGAYEAVP